jgi:hypothetical protein
MTAVTSTATIPSSTASGQGRARCATADTDATDEQVATLVKLTERYCVIFQTLAQPPALSASHRRTGAPASA